MGWKPGGVTRALFISLSLYIYTHDGFIFVFSTSVALYPFRRFVQYHTTGSLHFFFLPFRIAFLFSECFCVRYVLYTRVVLFDRSFMVNPYRFALSSRHRSVSFLDFFFFFDMCYAIPCACEDVRACVLAEGHKHTSNLGLRVACCQEVNPEFWLLPPLIPVLPPRHRSLKHLPLSQRSGIPHRAQKLHDNNSFLPYFFGVQALFREYTYVCLVLYTVYKSPTSLPPFL
jgi:hypothetical protein